MAVGGAWIAGYSGGVVGVRTSALVVDYFSRRSVASRAYFGYQVDDLTGWTCADSAIPNQSILTILMRNTSQSLSVVTISTNTLSQHISISIFKASKSTSECSAIHLISLVADAVAIAIDIAHSWTNQTSTTYFTKSRRTDTLIIDHNFCLLYTSPSPRDLSTSRMPSSA